MLYAYADRTAEGELVGVGGNAAQIHLKVLVSEYRSTFQVDGIDWRGQIANPP